MSHFTWNQKQVADPNSSAADWELLSYPDPPTHPVSPSPSGCLDRLFICPAWARKGYCDSKRNLMKKHCPSSCDFCYGKTQQQRSGSRPGGTQKKKRKCRELLWTVCQRSNGSQQVQPCRAMMDFLKDSVLNGEYLPLEDFVFRSGDYKRAQGGAAWFDLTEKRRYLGLLAVSTPSNDNTLTIWSAWACFGLLCNILVPMSLLHNRKLLLLTIKAHRLLWLSEIFCQQRGTVWSEDTIPGSQ